LLSHYLYLITVNTHVFNTMSQKSLSPSRSRSPSITSLSEDNHDLTLYHSLQETMKHPSSVSPAWVETVDFKNNPRVLHSPPHNDGSSHWVDNDNNLLCMAFPAVLDLYGKYGKTGPYFSFTGTQVSLSFNFILSLFNFIRNLLSQALL
jgi:hypothetical protein